MTAPADFILALWSQKPPGLVQAWSLDGRSWILRTRQDLDQLDGQVDVYTRVTTLSSAPPAGKRGGIDLARSMTGLWLDIDVDGGPDHRGVLKTGGVPDKQAAIELASSIRQPTLLVDSGYGVHAWHLFTLRWFLATNDLRRDATRLAEQWYTLHAHQASERGWRLDTGTRDLARMLRIPGTLNGKGGHHVPVTAVHVDGPRYERRELVELCNDAQPAGDGQTSLDIDGEPIDLVLREQIAPDLVRAVELAREIDVDLDNVWTGRKQLADPSPSARDMSIACRLVAAKWTDQQIADAIHLRRITEDPADQKGRRLGYLRKTIGRARAAELERDVRQQALDQLNTDWDMPARQEALETLKQRPEAA